MTSKTIKTIAFAFTMLTAGVTGAVAQDNRVHGFVQDDANQFVDSWINKNGALLIRVSNGRRGVPMKIDLKLEFWVGDAIAATKTYYVDCPAPPDTFPAIGVKGREKWFEKETLPPGVKGITITRITGSSQKRRPL
jgi:hypothetical protein